MKSEDITDWIIDREECSGYSFEKEKKADEMLKKLGYEKIEESKRYLRYSTDKRYGEHIDFELKLKQVRCTRVTCQGNTHFKYFSMQELQAINEKVKELGWLKKES